jgi:phenylpropionate dioxygenase-like ring-hydroxylating dioxygenase large terminal subunit
VSNTELKDGAAPAGGLEWVDNETAALGAAWYPVALSSEVGDEPVAVQLLGRYWVLARLNGQLAAFVDACPHRLIPLSAGKICDGILRCSYHGWEFDGNGAAVRIPSIGSGGAITGRAQLIAPAGLEERYGAIWMAPLPPVSPIPPFPEWDDTTFECRIDVPLRTSASAGQTMDNACDVSHFAFVHSGTFGGEAAEMAFPKSITRQGWQVTALYESPYRVLDDPRTQSGELPELQLSVHTKTVHLGATLELRMQFPDLGSTFTILASNQPEREGSTRIYRWFARNDIVGDEERWTDCLKVEEAILAEDLVTFETYRDHRLYLDLRKEIHVPADKLSVAYRRVLAELTQPDVSGSPEGSAAVAPASSSR